MPKKLTTLITDLPAWLYLSFLVILGLIVVLEYGTTAGVQISQLKPGKHQIMNIWCKLSIYIYISLKIQHLSERRKVSQIALFTAGCCFKCVQHLFNIWVCITYHMGTIFDKGRDTIAFWKVVILSMTLVVGYCPYKQGQSPQLRNQSYERVLHLTLQSVKYSFTFTCFAYHEALHHGTILPPGLFSPFFPSKSPSKRMVMCAKNRVWRPFICHLMNQIKQYPDNLTARGTIPITTAHNRWPTGVTVCLRASFLTGCGQELSKLWLLEYLLHVLGQVLAENGPRQFCEESTVCAHLELPQFPSQLVCSGPKGTSLAQWTFCLCCQHADPVPRLLVCTPWAKQVPFITSSL